MISAILDSAAVLAFTSSSCRACSSSCEISPLLLDADDADGLAAGCELAGVRTPSLSREDGGMPEGTANGAYTSAAADVLALLLLLLLLLLLPSPAAPSPISDGVAPRCCRREPADGGGPGEGRPALPLASEWCAIISRVIYSTLPPTLLSSSWLAVAVVMVFLQLLLCSSSCCSLPLLMLGCPQRRDPSMLSSALFLFLGKSSAKQATVKLACQEIRQRAR